MFLTPRLKPILEKAQKLINVEVIPHELEWLELPYSEVEPKIQQLRLRTKELGIWGPQLPESLGGLGLTLTEFGQLSEIMGHSVWGHLVFNCQAPDVGNMELLGHFGTEEQKQRWFLPLAKGEIRSCFSMTEPEFAGSNPVDMGTTAVRDGDEYVINGHKWFTTAADGAAFAIVMAVTNPDAAPHERASMLIVPMDTPGLELVRNISIMGHEGSGWMSHAELRYTDVRVPASNLIGKEGSGFMLAQNRLGPGRIHHCMRWIGICERSFELMCRYALAREISHNELLAGKQVVQHWIAECRAEIDAARWMVLHTAHKIDEEGVKASRIEISTIKFYVAGILQNVLDKAIQVHGAYGLTDDIVISHWYRLERAARIYDGPDEVHKTSLALQILKNYIL